MRSKRTMLLFVALLACLLPRPSAAGPALLLDASNGKVLYFEDQDHLWHPASLTKIMTAYVVFEALRAKRITLDQKISVSEKAHAQSPSKVGLPVGAEMTVDLALKALIVKSANDVAMMLAEAVGGSEEGFVKLMNDTARRLGMKQSNFVNPNGLPADAQVTTARDLARLSLAIIRNFPERLPLWTMQEVQVGKLRLPSHNKLLKSYDGADGLKTGFICDSGYNIVASATRDGRKLIAVVLGEPSGRERNLRAASLLEHGFQTYGWKLLFNTVTLDTLPRAAVAKGPISIRDSVVGWNCGKRSAQRPVAKGKRKPKTKSTAAARRAKSKPKAAAQAPVRKPGSGTTASATVKPKAQSKTTE